MNATIYERRYAFLCAALLLLCVIAAHPVAEVGINDDFSYVRSARTLADTGHVAYYGWASAMLGWLLPFGALFFKLFGFSFTVARSAVLLIGALTALLLQRTAVRLGLSEANATYSTLTTVLSPLYIPLSFSFMTDVPAVFALVLCLYLCLRALQTAHKAASMAWLSAAALSSTFLGTTRQTGWLGLFLFVPATVWLLRRRKQPILLEAIGIAACTACVYASLQWFSRQPYATHESLPASSANPQHTLEIAAAVTRLLLAIGCLFLPILMAFFANQRRAALYLPLLLATLLTSFLMIRSHSYAAKVLIAPSAVSGSYVTVRGILDVPEVGTRPQSLPQPIRYLLTFAIDASAFSFLLFLVRELYASKIASRIDAIPWRTPLFLLGPFLFAYCGFLFLRAASDMVFDRYLLPPLVFAPILLVRLYQDRVAPALPAAAYAVVAAYAFFAVAGTHDLFAAERARIAAANELRAAGIQPTSFYAGFGYDGWTQIDAQGYVAAGGINLPPGAPPYDEAHTAFRPCGYTLAHYFTAIDPRYAVSYDNVSCQGPAPFPPVAYSMWLPPYRSAVYIRAVDPNAVDKREDAKP